jgi:hypothetical protein
MQRSRNFPMQGFAVSVGWSACLAIHDTLGCELKVLIGQAWITVDGSPDDVIVNPQGSVQLQRGIHYNVSALYNETTILIESPRDAVDVGFSMNRHGGGSVLNVTAGSPVPMRSSAQMFAAISAAARRWFAMPDPRTDIRTEVFHG